MSGLWKVLNEASSSFMKGSSLSLRSERSAANEDLAAACSLWCFRYFRKVVRPKDASVRPLSSCCLFSCKMSLPFYQSISILYVISLYSVLVFFSYRFYSSIPVPPGTMIVVAGSSESILILAILIPLSMIEYR